MARGCQEAKAEAVARFGLRTVPTETPSLDRARTLCTRSRACRATARRAMRAPLEAETLDPRPASFREPARLAALSPYRVYNTLTFGVPGTGDGVLRVALPRRPLVPRVLRPAPRPRGRARARPGGPEPRRAGRAHRSRDRRVAARGGGRTIPPPCSPTCARRRRSRSRPPAWPSRAPATCCAAAVVAFDEGRAHEADRRVMDAYLEGFEPLEPRLRARDAEATASVEAGFRDLRVALQQGDARAVRATEHDLDRVLDSLGKERRAAVPMLAAVPDLLPRGRRGRPARRRPAGGRAAASGAPTPSVTCTPDGWPRCPRASLTWWVSEPGAGGERGRPGAHRGGGRPDRRRRALLDELLDDLEGGVPPLDGIPAQGGGGEPHPPQPRPARRRVVPRRVPRGGGDRALHPGAPAGGSRPSGARSGRARGRACWRSSPSPCS